MNTLVYLSLSLSGEVTMDESQCTDTKDVAAKINTYEYFFLG